MRRSSGKICRTFVVLIVTAADTRSRICEVERLHAEAVLSVLPVRKSVERNEAAHLGLLNPT